MLVVAFPSEAEGGYLRPLVLHLGSRIHTAVVLPERASRSEQHEVDLSRAKKDKVPRLMSWRSN